MMAQVNPQKTQKHHIHSLQKKKGGGGYPLKWMLWTQADCWSEPCVIQNGHYEVEDYRTQH